jgi:CRISPR-associated protein Cas1
MKRTLYFQTPCYLSTKLRQLVITRKDTGEILKRPIEDVGFVVLDNPQITFSQTLIQRLAEHNVAVIFCNQRHLPSSMLLHLETNQVQSELFTSQIEASVPLKKRLWQQTVKAKIRNQAAVLDLCHQDGNILRNKAKKVTSGDTTNQEAQAARLYWPKVFGEFFSRDRYGEPPNQLLNYGYTIIRAAVARALSGSGLLPTLGIFHHNRYNAYCLADDIMEPYRPYVDQLVRTMYLKNEDEEDVSTESKKELLSLLQRDVVMGKQKRTMMTAVTETTSSLAQCFSGDKKRISYPKL